MMKFLHAVALLALAGLANSADMGQAIVNLMESDVVKGALILTPEKGGVRVMGDISGLTPGKHGLHLHQFSDFSEGCISCGPHWNPKMSVHGGAKSPPRHPGDMGNIVANADGVARVKQYLKGVKMADLLGRAIVVHADADDLGKGGNPGSLANGNAGLRIACGGIGYKFVSAPTPAATPAMMHDTTPATGPMMTHTADAMATESMHM